MFYRNKYMEFLYRLSNKFLDIVLFKIFRLREHPNVIGKHFYLPVIPVHVFGLDLYVFRINIFFPVFISISFGRLGREGFQIYGGIKCDATETEYLGEPDYLVSFAFRKIELGINPRWKSEASF